MNWCQMSRDLKSLAVGAERRMFQTFSQRFGLTRKLANPAMQVRDLIGQGGAYVNNKAWKGLEAKVGPDQALSGRGVLLRAGKKNYHLLMIE